MKILVFEYVTGGGFSREEIPGSLAAEGLLMLKASLRDLTEIAGVEVTVMLDVRFIDAIPDCRGAVEIVGIDRHGLADAKLLEQSERCDAVWLVAPEIDNILFDWVRMLERRQKRVLCSSSESVALTSNKLETYRHLTKHRIDAVPSEHFRPDRFQPVGRQVIKPIDGMGCERTFRVDDIEDWAIVAPQLGEGAYIVQPYIDGTPASLSCLFNAGRAWLLCRNVQVIELNECRFRLTACRVNEPGITEEHRSLVDRIAKALPGLSGYVGIDIIEAVEGLTVLEINPRLTTSYAGIRQALGVNVAEYVLRMPADLPILNPMNNRSITVAIDGGESYAI